MVGSGSSGSRCWIGDALLLLLLGATYFTFVKVKAHSELTDGEAQVNAGNFEEDLHVKDAALSEVAREAPPRDMVPPTLGVWLPTLVGATADNPEQMEHHPLPGV